MNSTLKVTAKGKDFYGPPNWVVLHTFAATFRPEKANYFKMYLECLCALFPCDECAMHLRETIKRFPPDPYLTNNHDAFFYSYLIHDRANKHANEKHPGQPPKKSPNFDDVKSYYFGALSQECKDCAI